jgi:HTH-type transcriptional regulator/antitoxin HigA
MTTAQEYDAALRAIEALWTAPAGSPEADQLEILVTLVEAYEATHHPIAPPDPIDAITCRMAQGGQSLQDREASLGRHAADVLARKRPLTLPMRRRGHRGLGIPADIVLQSPCAHGPERPPPRGRRRRMAYQRGWHGRG